MLRKLHLTMLVLLLVSVTSMYGQKLLKKANKQFELKAYDLAIQNYIKTLAEYPENQEAKVKLAEAYRLTNRPLDAVNWYRKVSDMDIEPEYLKNYAHTLKKIGKYSLAQEMYIRYSQFDPIEGEHFAQSCDYAKSALSSEDQYSLSLFGANTKASDFGVSFYEGNVVFSSFNDATRSKGVNNKSFINKGTNKLYIAEGLRPKRGQDALVLRGSLKDDENIGPISYAQGSNVCAYTQNNFINGHSFVADGDVDLSIYLAEVDYNGDFKNEKPFSYNELGYSTGFPTFSFQGGTAMYFSSNRPGGLGGFDIYVSYYNNGEWSYPENLGDNVNTRGNEITPHFDGETLLFASDYHHGLGGYDVFETFVEDGYWTAPKNLGKGINSPSDDYFPSKNVQNKDIYFSSNRLGGRGKDDIYIGTPVYRDILAANDVEEADNIFVPKAMSLADLDPFAGQSSNTNPEAANVNFTENTAIQKTAQSSVEADMEVPPAFKLPDLSSRTSGSMSGSLSSARKVAYGEIINTSSNVYFVQLAAFFNRTVDIDPYTRLSELGNIYKVYKSTATKVRLGYYLDRAEAQTVLKQVRARGFKDAFITYDALDTEHLELAMSSQSTSTPSYTSTGSSEYKIRLASYEDPIWFDVNKVKGIGEIEQWTKGSWTIFVLSGYSNLEEARRAQIKSINRGFVDAEIVVDNNGILERMAKN